MCCLFGMVDYGQNFSGKHRARLLSILGKECEERGTDATGYAYNSGGRLHIYKRPLPARRMHLVLPNDAIAVMGHTRMTTQGSEKRNHNNHPFLGQVTGHTFALAHNGVLANDISLRQELKLPQTHIETDSYIAVQLVERKGTLDFASLRYMAEQVKGSFTFSVLDDDDNLYLVKGNSPLCLLHFSRMGLYLYASTEEILARALRRMAIPETPVRVELNAGDILRIDRCGNMERGAFDAGHLMWSWGRFAYGDYGSAPYYLDELKSVASYCGYAPALVDRLLGYGFTTDEIEEFLYCGEL